MAKQMSYTDPNTGAVFPAAVWTAIGVYIDVSGPDVRLVFPVYKDKTAAAIVVGKALGIPAFQNTAKYSPIGSVAFTLSQAEFAALATSPPVGATLIDAISEACYKVAESSTQNRKPGPDVEDPQNPGHFKPSTLPFFHGATDVNLFS